MKKSATKSPSPTTSTELHLYVKTALFSLVIFGLFYAYTNWLGSRSVMNKAVADTGIFLMGLSMLLSGLGYFWNVFDTLVIYRKSLGLVGFAYGLAHLFLSWSAFQALLQPTTWEQGKMWPAFTGTLALVIFTVMAIISNTLMARLIGGKLWKYILRTGYIGVILVWLHVVLLKSARWVTWYQDGMQTPPALSLLISIFMVGVIAMRVALWFALSRRKTVILKK
jgi:DMSO/TMAO reductase YedYZ heme-binding membrane subunit